MPWINTKGATDADAIHDNVAGELAAMTEKTTPVAADLIYINDSEDSDNPKAVQIGNLPSGGGGGGGSLLLAPHTAPPATGWSWVNQGSATVATQANGAILFVSPPSGANNLIGRVRSVAGTWTHTAAIGATHQSTNGGPGLVVRESSTGKLTFLYYRRSNRTMVIEHWTNPTSFSAGVTSINFNDAVFHWYQIEDNGTNLLLRVSNEGFPNSFHQVASVGRTAFMAGGPDQVGWFVRDNNNSLSSALYSWA